MKYLYQIIPGGPVAEGCRLAGLNVPAGSSRQIIWQHGVTKHKLKHTAKTQL